MFDHKRALVALDGGASSEAVLRFVLEIAGPLDMRVVLVRVVEPLDSYLGYVSDGPFPPGAAELDSVFYFTDTPYRWLPLLKERLAHR